MASDLSRQPIVSKIKITKKDVKVHYATGIKEVYYLNRPPMKRRGNNTFDLTSDMSVVGEPIGLYPAFETDPTTSPNKNALAINREEFERGSFIDKRIAMHRLFMHVQRYAGEEISYPQQKVRDDWAEVINSDLSRFTTTGYVNFFPRGNRGIAWQRLLRHFFGTKDDKVYRHLWYAMTRLCVKKTTKIDVYEVLRTAEWLSKKKAINPLIYAAMLKQLGVSSVIDIFPGRGHKALACAILGILYVASNSGNLAVALDKGLCSTTGLNYVEAGEPWGNWAADLLISDNNFMSFDISRTDQYTDVSRRMIAYAPRAKRFELQTKHSPSSVMKIFCSAAKAMNLRDPDYVFIW